MAAKEVPVMFCPICKKMVTEPTSGCRTCGLQFGDDIQQRLRLYFILEKELENLTSSSRQLDLQIHSLRGKITEYQRDPVANRKIGPGAQKGDEANPTS